MLFKIDDTVITENIVDFDIKLWKPQLETGYQIGPQGSSLMDLSTITNTYVGTISSFSPKIITITGWLDKDNSGNYLTDLSKVKNYIEYMEHTFNLDKHWHTIYLDDLSFPKCICLFDFPELKFVTLAKSDECQKVWLIKFVAIAQQIATSY